MSDEERNSFLPMPVKVKPYMHQQKAFDFACNIFGLVDGRKKSDGVAFLMEMGTGKTMTAIGVAGILYQCGRIHRVLIVCPLSITGVWKEEFEKFADFPFQLTILTGSSEKKKSTLRDFHGEGLLIVVVNYESVWRIETNLMAYAADLIIADEGHKLKENRSRQSKGMHDLGDNAKYKLLLTGTVITNKEIDVFSQYRFLDRRIFGTSFYAFRNRYFSMEGYGFHTPVFRKFMSDEFLKKLHSIAYRVTKEECLDLPEVREEIRYVDLEEEAMVKYRELEKESYVELKSSEVTASNILTKMLRLSQLTGGHLTDDTHHTEAVSKAKIKALEDIIDTAMNEDQKLVLMARFKPELDDIELLLQKKKIGYAVVRGGVKNRAEEVRKFQENEDCRMFVGQIAAAGLGITLTQASTMIFYSLDYSMANFDQAKARIHRAGQKQNCLYLYLIAKGTVDTKVLRSLQHKVNLARMLVDDYRHGRNPYME